MGSQFRSVFGPNLFYLDSFRLARGTVFATRPFATPLLAHLFVFVILASTASYLLGATANWLMQTVSMKTSFSDPRLCTGPRDW